MMSIEERIKKYEQDLEKTLKGYEQALETTSTKEEVENYKKHIEKIKHIKEVGVKKYHGLSNLASINYFADNYKNMPAGLFETYTQSFGIEKDDEYYNMIRMENDAEKVRNVIWADCYGMDYELMDKTKAKEEFEKAETLEERAEIICRSGYDNNPNPNSYCNPTHLPPELLEATVKKINEKAQTYK